MINILKILRLPVRNLLFLSLLILNSSFLISQNFPYGFNYQAVVRDANGSAKTNTTVGLRLTILKSNSTGTVTYQETQTAITNSMGQFNVTVGGGSFVSGTVNTFSLINWANDIYFLKSEIQTGSSTFSIIGTQQLMSVPYALAAPDPTPPGIIQAYGASIAPAGYLLCDGSAVSRTVYSKLFNVMGTAYGAGDGSTTFNLPDLRGQFLRGVDGSAGNDPDKLTRTASAPGGNVGNIVGSREADAFQGHGHSLIRPSDGGIVGTAPGTLGTSPGSACQPSGPDVVIASNPLTLSAYGTAKISIESRPKNIYVNFIVKY
ncbi:MAG: tail fiber protein [Bacteroidetes bacterium]|nr:tail fiber protein [Bacteroidota bacterium]